MSDNLKLWKLVEKTNPAHTKNANVRGNKITAIAPQYQIMQATEQFGSYGTTWGFKTVSIDSSLMSVGLVTFKGLFFYPGGEFEILSSIGIYRDNAQTKIDDDFGKKVETDALTKALSKLGFNADVFMGLYDDNRYVQQMNEEFAAPAELTETDQEWIALVKENAEILETINDLEYRNFIKNEAEK
jgi:hypothetical protein